MKCPHCGKEIEIENLRKENQKKGMLKKASSGKVMSKPAFGYKIEKGILIPDEEKTKIIEEIFLEFRDKDFSLNQLSKKYGFSVNGLKKILRNFTYLGKVKFNGEIHNAEHKPIISSTLFNQVQDKLERLGIKQN
jgi:DNA invertase Pin-like site-specific DNA recombinase